MRHLFNIDSPLMSFLSKIFDLAWLNILTVICCIPIVTIGAALTAMFTVEYKNVINDHATSVTKEYLAAFKANFKQATLTWLIYMAAMIVVGADIAIVRSGEIAIPSIIGTMVIVLGVLVFLSALYTFALLSHYENTIRNTLKNAWILLIANLPRTALMVLFIGIWGAVLWMFFYQILPLILLFSLSVPGWFVMLLMSHIFEKLDSQSND